MIKAPSITSLRVTRLAANFIQLDWDNVGGNFYYVVERKVADDPNAGWVTLGLRDTNTLFDDGIAASSSYIYRVQSTYNTFIPSDWTESETITTFALNAYNITHSGNLRLTTNFVTSKFAENKDDFDFDTDAIMAGLMGEDYVFTPEIDHTSSIENFFVQDKETHEVQGDIEPVCKNKDRVIIAEIDQVLYLFERYQHVIKVSNDRGQNWKYYKALNGRVGNPVARVCTYQSETTTFVLGYTEIFYGRPTTDLKWSNNVEKFSSGEFTFAKASEDNAVGFPVEVFGSYANLPLPLNKRAEAMACSDDYLYVAGRNQLYRSPLIGPEIGIDGKRLWEDGFTSITKDPENRTITKKLDTLNGSLYALVTGQVKVVGGIMLDPTKRENVIPQSQYDGLYKFDDTNKKWTRIFGNTEEERKHIDYSGSDMSTDGDEIFFGYVNHDIEIVKDDDLDLWPDAVKYSHQTYYPSDKKNLLITMRTKGTDIYPGPQRYYAEQEYTWSRRSGTRSWIAPNDKAVVVYPNRRYEYHIDPAHKMTKELWDRGTVKLFLDNVNFSGFTNYTNGVLFYRQSGEIIGYYELNYRARDQLSIFWQPTNTFLTANLVNQVHDVEVPPEEPYGLVDPDLSPLIVKMTPEHYMPDGNRLTAFADSYLEYLSTGEDSAYLKLKNIIKNKYPKEKDNFEHLYSEINRRNIYLDKQKRDEVVRFFETRSSDFYSTKGVVDSYKFLFKLLYDADVDLEIESLNGLEYDIVVLSGDVTEDIVGTTVYTPTGRANVTYIEREYNKGQLQWRITIHNLLGKFVKGQVLKSERFADFEADIITGVRGKEISYNDIDYINRSRVYYTMKIKSEIPLSRYKDDVIRFVHPIGFGFIGVTLITALISSGLLFKHRETIIDIMKAYRWDAGLPSVLPEYTYQLDINQDHIQKDPNTGKPIIVPNRYAGEDPIGHWPNYDRDELIDPRIPGVLPSARRKELSPTFDAAWVTYCYYQLLAGKRLKDNIGNPRDPAIPTQVNVPEDPEV